MTEQYLETIYKTAIKELGTTKGREFVSMALSNILFELEESGEVTQKDLNKP